MLTIENDDRWIVLHWPYEAAAETFARYLGSVENAPIPKWSLEQDPEDHEWQIRFVDRQGFTLEVMRAGDLVHIDQHGVRKAEYSFGAGGTVSQKGDIFDGDSGEDLLVLEKRGHELSVENGRARVDGRDVDNCWIVFFEGETTFWNPSKDNCDIQSIIELVKTHERRTSLAQASRPEFIRFI